MSIINLYLCFFTIIVTSVALASDVLELTDHNFETVIRQHDIVLAEFYAPWCAHCKKLAPEFEEAATTLKANEPPIVLVKVDCTAETTVCGKYGVTGYPALKIFKNGQVLSEYNGPREAAGIVKYMKSRAGPSSKELGSVQDVERFLDNNEHSIIGFFSSSDATLTDEFHKASGQLSDKYRFAYTTNADVLSKYGYNDQVVIFQPPRLQVKLESAANAYDGSATLESFIQNELHGLVGHRTQANAAEFKAPLVVIYYNVDFVKDAKGANYVRNRIIKVAQKVRGVRFAISSADEFRRELNEFGLTDPLKGDAKLVVARGDKNAKYKMAGDYSAEALETFARDLAEGRLEVFMKSEPIPDPVNNDGPVKTVVAKTFNEIVNDPSKDVLIEFYAPWCAHCKNLVPVYNELAKKLRNEASIVIAKMDATANDLPPNYSIKGFPTIFFVPKNSKSNPKKYEGGREVDDFIEYIAREATESLDGYTRDGKKIKKAKKSDL